MCWAVWVSRQTDHNRCRESVVDNTSKKQTSTSEITDATLKQSHESFEELYCN